MKSIKILKRLILFILCIATTAQCGFVMPVSAEEEVKYTYFMDFQEGRQITPEHPIIIPDEDIKPGALPEPHEIFISYNNDITSFTGQPIPYFPEPYRIIGATFEGWFTAPSGGEEITKEKIITKDMLDDSASITLYGHWSYYNSPVITQDSLNFNCINEKGEPVYNGLIFADENYAPDPDIQFDRDKTEYYAVVYGNVDKIKMNFEQYSPEADTEITLNGNSVNADITDKTGTAYIYDDNSESPKLVEQKDETVIGREIATEYMTLEKQTVTGKENTLSVEISFDSEHGGRSQTYTFHIMHYDYHIDLAYGNTPYGRIMQNSGGDADAAAAAKNTFDETYKYGSGQYQELTYSKKAWDRFDDGSGSGGTEVPRGTWINPSNTSDRRYINYDKDETAIVVYAGETFIDPGITLYDKAGEETQLTSEHNIKRTITYAKVDNLQYQEWKNAETETDVSYINGTPEERPEDYKIDLLKKEEVRPGIYTIEYSHTHGEGAEDYFGTITARRNLIVLPSPGDINMDNYVNALDTLVYNAADNIKKNNMLYNRLYLYRAMDVNADGEVNETDRELIKSRGAAAEYYPASYSETPDNTPHEYTVQSTPIGDKTQMYMYFLGTGDTPAESPVEDAASLQEGDTFWIGYDLQNTQAIASGDGIDNDMKLITLSVDYDQRYIKPAADTIAQFAEILKKQDAKLEAFDFAGASNIANAYTTDRSTACYSDWTWKSTSDVKTLTLEMYIKQDASYNLGDGYLLKIPFEVVTLPQQDGRHVISTHLSADGFNAERLNSYGSMWDTSGEGSSVTGNLMDIVQYMGDCPLTFAAPPEAIPITSEAEYGTYYHYYDRNFENGTLGADSELPPGVEFDKSTGNINGTPEKAGDYDIYINGVHYSLKVNKAPLKVTAKSYKKTYGDDNPPFLFDYDTSALHFTDSVDPSSPQNIIKTVPEITCEADSETECGKYPIKLSGGEADNYEFVYVEGELEITKRPINITGISKSNVPECRYEDRNKDGDNTATIHSESGAVYSDDNNPGNDTFTVYDHEIVNGDKVKIDYSVYYSDTSNEGVQTVDIKDPAIVTDEEEFARGANYEIESCVLTAEGHVQEDAVTSIALAHMPKYVYTYGETLDLSELQVSLRYNTKPDEVIDYKDFGSHRITVTYSDDGAAAASGDRLPVSRNGKRLTITYTDGIKTDTGTLTVNKATLRLKADDKERDYGDDNSVIDGGFTCHIVDNNQLAEWDKSIELKKLDGYIAPTLTCDAVARTPAGTKADILISGGSSDNYTFDFTDGTGKLTVNKRPLTVTGITGIPPLTPDAYYDKSAPYFVEASAYAGASDQTSVMTLDVGGTGKGGLITGDAVKMNYKAKYENATPGNANITVTDFTIDDEYCNGVNYYIAAVPTDSIAGGNVQTRNVKKIEITKEPTLNYTYGEPLDLSSGTMKVYMDTGEEFEGTIPTMMSDHGITAYYNDLDATPAKTGDRLTVADSGKTITFRPPVNRHDVKNVTTEPIEISRAVLNVSADNISVIYGAGIPEYTLTYSGFQYEEDKNVLTQEPHVTCKEYNGIVDVNKKTPSGEYRMIVGGGAAANYSFNYIEGRCIISKRALRISKIDIELLSSADKRAGKLDKTGDIYTNAIDCGAVFEENFGPVKWDDGSSDALHITYAAKYRTDSELADITSCSIATEGEYKIGENYYIEHVTSPQSGSVADEIITNIEITSDPTKETGGGEAHKFSYGDELDLSASKFAVTVTYDSERVDENVTFAELADHGITAEYVKDGEIADGSVEDGSFLTLDYNGRSIRLNPPKGSKTESVSTGELSVGKRRLDVIVHDASFTYGDNPDDYVMEYKNYAEGEDMRTLEADDAYTPPTLSCKIGGVDADNKTNAGNYENAIKADVSVGDASNYYFAFDDGNSGTLTVNKRDLKITAITGKVPVLTAAEAFNHGYELPIKLDGTADNDDGDSELTFGDGSLVNNDNIRITYKAVYNSLEHADKMSVDIEDVAFAEDCDAAKNYNITESPTTASGRIQMRLITAIEVRTEPDMEYTYGEWMSMAGGTIVIKYNSGYATDPIAFADAADYGVSMEFVKLGEPADTVIGEARNNALLTVKEHNGAVIRLGVSHPDFAVEEFKPTYTGELTVHKHIMHVRANDSSMTYGDETGVPSEYGWEFDAGDFVNGETSESDNFRSGLTVLPSASCKDKTGADISAATRAGDYDIVPAGLESSDNYYFEYVNGVMTVNKRPVTVTRVTETEIPPLTSEALYQHNYEPPVYINDNKSKGANVEASNLVGDDIIAITYSVIYNVISGDPGEIEVTVDNITLDDTETGTDNDCYVISSEQAPFTQTGGTVDAEYIEYINIEIDPTLMDNSDVPISYTYGGIIDLNRGSVTIRYNSGRTLDNLRFNQIFDATEGSVSLVYVDDEGNEYGEAQDGDTMYASKHNGKSIEIKVKNNRRLSTQKTKPLVVNKAVITAKAEDKNRIYGDANPEFTIEYSGFVNGDDKTSDNFLNELNEPTITCAAAEKSPVGTYDINLSGGSSADYEFECTGAVLTVEPRPLDVISVIGGVPALTAKIIRENPGERHVLRGAARNTSGQLNLGNLSSGDAIKVDYNAEYTSTEPNQRAVVTLTDVTLDKEYGAGGNYVLRSVPGSAVGRIYSEQISLVEVVNPPKLQYTYGEGLDLSQPGARITYDSGRIESDVPYSQLDEYGVELKLMNASGEELDIDNAINKLTVTEHNNSYLVLVPHTTLSNVRPAVAGPFKVDKRAININIAPVRSTYGENHRAQFSYDYDYSDFVYGETPETAEGFTAPNEYICVERDGTDVSETTGVGTYSVTMSGASSTNYRFIYNSANLVITPRPIVVTNITGIPHLTSSKIALTPGAAQYKVEGSAGNADNSMTADNIVNNDIVTIKYLAVYIGETPTAQCDVGIEYVSMGDNDTDQNYTIDPSSVRNIIGGGAVDDREIIDIKIDEQPPGLGDYVYGDTLNLDGGGVTLTYDSGYVETGVSFKDLASLGVSLTYTGGGKDDVPLTPNGILTVPEHNGRVITLSAPAADAVSTDTLTVKKFKLRYGAFVVDPIEYDGVTTATTGRVVFAATANRDRVTASGVFTFDTPEAGEDKTVYVTDIALQDAWNDNYELADGTEWEAKGTIEKASNIPAAVTADDITVSADTNAITVTPPAMTDTQINGGAKYEYSIDGGHTWQESNVFENPGLGLDCLVCVRFAETANYKQYDATAPISVKTYANRITLVATDKDEDKTLASFYTNVSEFEKEDNLKSLIGETEETYYSYYSDAERHNRVEFPLTISGETVIYTSLSRSSRGSSKGGSTNNQTPKPTASPSPEPSPAPEASTPPEATPDTGNEPEASTPPLIITVPEPYISGYDGMIRPDDSMTRAEAAAIMVNISGADDADAANITFPDVSADMWYAEYIPRAAAKGCIAGFEDGLFRPDDTVTREQFVTMVVRMAGLESASGSRFIDISGDRWSAGYIYAAANAGIVIGYADGTFMPESTITRAEAVNMINALVGIVPDKDAIDSIACPYSDLPKSHWAYYELMAASYEY